MEPHFLSGMLYFLPTSSTRVSFMPAFKNVPELGVSDLFDPVDQGVPFHQDFSLSLDRYHRIGAGMEVSQICRTGLESCLEFQYGHGKVEATDKEWVILNGSGTFSTRSPKEWACFLVTRKADNVT